MVKVILPAVEVSRDILGWLLTYTARAPKPHREGEPVKDASGDVIYFKSRAAAKMAAIKFNTFSSK